MDNQSRVYANPANGRVVRLDASGEVETFIDTGSRPLSMNFDTAGNLILTDTWKDLLHIDPQDRVKVLATEADGVPSAFVDDLDIASDGRIYFGDASSRFHQLGCTLDLLEARPYGRLLHYGSFISKTEVLLRDPYLANGMTLSTNEDFILVNETYHYRITCYWPKGEKAGQHEVFTDNLPGLPDNFQGDRRGAFWVVLLTPHKADVDFLHRRPWLEVRLTKLSRIFPLKPIAHGLVIAIDEQGRIARSLHNTSGHHLRMITSAKLVGSQLYFGSLENNRADRLAILREKRDKKRPGANARPS